MDLNPYESQAVAASQPEPGEQSTARGPRPLGIWILSGLHVLFGIAALGAAIALQVAAAVGWEDATGPIEGDWLLTLAFCAIAAYAIASGIGLWRGDRWGWWLSAFYWVGVAMNWIGEGSFIIWNMRSEELPDFAVLAGVALVRLLVHVLFVMYHFKNSVRRYFGLQSLGIVRTIVILGAIWIGIGIAVGTAVFIYMLATRGAMNRQASLHAIDSVNIVYPRAGPTEMGLID